MWKLMVIGHLFFSILIGYAGTWHGKDTRALAAIKDPVVDLFLHLPIQKDLPISPASYGDITCRRAHQGLANEIVTVSAIDGENVQVSFDNVIYGFDEQTKQPLSSFWTTKEHLIFFQDLPEEVLNAFPGPWGKVQDTLVLIRPWKHYSLGTRFVRELYQDTKYTYGATLFNTRLGKIEHIKIPKKHARVETLLNSQEARQYFVKLANDIVDYARRSSDDKVIPYVWGGSSYVKEYKDTFFSRLGWRRLGGNSPYTGYDCSELVLRLAQSSGIPYRNKTTLMLCEQAKEVDYQDKLEDGDLLWMPGHVMIVSSISRNEIIEARGYGTGYGKIQRLTLPECFLGIQNYEQLLNIKKKGKSVRFLNKDGSISGEINNFKFFKLIN